MARWDRAALIFLLLLNRLIRVFFSALIAFHMKIDTFSLSRSLLILHISLSSWFRVNSPSSCWHPPAPFRPSCRPARVSWTTRGTWAPPWVPAKSTNEIFLLLLCDDTQLRAYGVCGYLWKFVENLFSSFFLSLHLDKLGWILLRFSKQPHHIDAALRCCAGLTSVMRLSWTIFTLFFAEKILYDRFFCVFSRRSTSQGSTAALRRSFALSSTFFSEFAACESCWHFEFAVIFSCKFNDLMQWENTF